MIRINIIRVQANTKGSKLITTIISLFIILWKLKSKDEKITHMAGCSLGVCSHPISHTLDNYMDKSFKGGPWSYRSHEILETIRLSP